MDALLSHDFDQGYQIQLKKIKATVAPKQIDKFKEAARELETDDREEAFDGRLKRVAKAPKGDKPKKNVMRTGG